MSAPDATSPARPPSRAAWIASTLVALLAAPWWGWQLGRPTTAYWDEGFYLTDAHRFFRPDGLLNNPEHPPLGKWLMGLSITLVGDDAVAWRLPSLIASVLLVTSLPLWLEPLGIVTSRTPRWVLTVPSCVLLVDPTTFSTARIATLDALLVLFYVSAALALVLSRGAGLSESQARRARIAAGALAGLALGTKWTALTLLPVFVLSHVRYEDKHVRLAGRAMLELFAPCLVIYLACFALPGATTFDPHAFPQINGPLDPSLPWPARVAVLHARMVSYHTYYFQSEQRSLWYEWLVARQATFYAARLDGDHVRVITSIGSPFTWIATEVATLVALALAVRDRHRPTILLLAFPVAQLALWAVVLRMTFLYYMSAIVPFFAIASALVIARGLERAREPGVASRYAAVAVAAVLSIGAAWQLYTLPFVRGDALTEAELVAYARGPAGPFLFHDAFPVERVLELVHGTGFGAARLDP